MAKPEDSSPAEVLRAKRLEIVDEEGKVRAVLGTREEEGAGGLTVFDASGRIRARLEAGDVLGQDSGLFLFDTDGEPRAMVGMDKDPDKGSALVLLDRDGNQRAYIHVQPGGQAGLAVSAGEKERAVKITAMDDGKLYLGLGGEGAPIAGLSLSEEEGKDPSADLGLSDKDGRAGVVISGRRSGPFVRLLDRRTNVRASLELGANGVPELYIVGEEGRPARGPNALDRLIGQRGPTYQVFLFGAVYIVCGVVGISIASAFATAPIDFPAALIISVALAALVTLGVVSRRRNW